MSRIIVRNTDAQRRAPKWIAALPLAGLLVACASYAQSGVGAEQPAVIDFKSCAKPAYPAAELGAKHEGTVRMKFLVNIDGSIGSSRVEGTSGFPALDEAALSALNKCHFRPARKDGQPAQTWASVQYVWMTS